MEIKTLRTLEVDEGFRNLIRPLFETEYQLLEDSIIRNGCLDPLKVWNGVIVDGHNRYEICTRYGIPFETEELSFECREEAISWICTNQLGRRNLTDETRRFLIGMKYESEKVINSRHNVLGINQYTKTDSLNSTNRKTSFRIAEENNISHSTVEKYAEFTRALAVIGKKEPKLVPKILSGKYKVSHNKLLELSLLPKEDVQSINLRLERSSPVHAKYHATRKEIPSSPVHPPEDGSNDHSCHTVKDMPEFDPDSEITVLTLTIPSWESSIARVRSVTDLSIVSSNAKDKLNRALLDLRSTIDDMLITIKEDIHG